ncbi:SGNH/GDSL hydrolase family protein [Caballeronia grimmiae]|uniref:SGNH/GDSL hydrolase family protein n=1 Tax=Caballeronia grimmiae TaxID=1071679 RepID=UPI0038B9635E
MHCKARRTRAITRLRRKRCGRRSTTGSAIAREFDAVVDFDAVIRDPAHPISMQTQYDSGDHLHPNDAGYVAMANAIDLSVLRGRQRDRDNEEQ